MLGAGYRLDPLLGLLLPDYLHLVFPRGCLASSEYSEPVPRIRWEIRGQVEAVWPLSPSFKVTHFCLILFIRSESLRYHIEMWIRYRDQHLWKVELFNSEQGALSPGINHFVSHEPWPVKEQKCVSGIYVADSFTLDLSLQTTTAHGSLASETRLFPCQYWSFMRIARALTHVLPQVENHDKCYHIFTSVVA